MTDQSLGVRNRYQLLRPALLILLLWVVAVTSDLPDSHGLDNHAGVSRSTDDPNRLGTSSATLNGRPPPLRPDSARFLPPGELHLSKHYGAANGFSVSPVLGLTAERRRERLLQSAANHRPSKRTQASVVANGGTASESRSDSDVNWTPSDSSVDSKSLPGVSDLGLWDAVVDANSGGGSTEPPSLSPLVNSTLLLLESFYNALNGLNWSTVSNGPTFWLDRTNPNLYCSWVGIVCWAEIDPSVDNSTIPSSSIPGFPGSSSANNPSYPRGSICTFELSRFGLLGPIPPNFLHDLSVLHPDIISIDFSFNAVSAQLSDFTNFPNLYSLALIFTFTYDDLATVEWNRFTQLMTISLSGTYLSGSVPASMFQSLTVLCFFDLASPWLNGTLPNIQYPIIQANEGGIGNGNASLEALVIAATNITGPIPDGLTSLIWKMVFFDISDNQFNGTIPEQFLNSSSLLYLDLSNNEFEGSLNIPSNSPIGSGDSSTSFYTNALLVFDVSNNNFVGSMPAVHSVSYRASKNQFNGTFIDTFLSIVKAGANVIDISYNPLTPGATFPSLDTVYNPLDSPRSFRMESVVSLSMAGLELSGTLSKTTLLTFFVSLQYLDLSDNPALTGSLPLDWIYESESMSALIVENCSFHEVHNSGNMTVFPIETSSFTTSSSSPSTSFKYNFDASYRDLEFSNNQNIDYGTYKCPTISWGKRSVGVVGITPAYYNYRGCSCHPGLAGAPPNCEFVPASDTSLEIALPVVIVFCIALTTFVLVRRRLKIIRRERRADALLAEYPAALAGRNKKTKCGDDDSAVSSFVMTELTGPQFSTNSSNQFQIDRDFIIPFKKIEVLRVIASGASGVVSVGIWQNTRVAIKQFHPGMSMDSSECISEARLHARLRHPNIVLLLGVCIEPLCTITEFMSKGSLYDILRTIPGELDRQPILSGGRRKQIALQIAQGMQYLHSRDVLHRDLKSLNVLIDDHWTAKVADFGASRANSRSTMTVGIGTTSWMAPETFESGHYTSKCDVYSYGIVLWEIVSGKIPFDEYKYSFDVMDAVKGGVRPDIPDRCTELTRDLISRCWHQDPDCRPTFEDIVCLFNNSSDPDLIALSTENLVL